MKPPNVLVLVCDGAVEKGPSSAHDTLIMVLLCFSNLLINDKCRGIVNNGRTGATIYFSDVYDHDILVRPLHFGRTSTTMVVLLTTSWGVRLTTKPN